MPTRISIAAIFLMLTLPIQACATREDVPSNPIEPNPVPASDSGTVVVDPVPPDANASWSLRGPGNYAHDGTGQASLPNLPIGQYTLSWHEVSGWDPPVPPEVTKELSQGETATFIGIYRSLSGPAVDNIVGAPLDGSSVTVNGLEFDSRTASIQWLGGKNGVIEGLPNGTLANGWGPGWKIGVSSSMTPAQISNQRAHSGSKAIWSRVDSSVLNSWNSGFAYEPGGEFDEIYVSWWTYFRPIRESGCTSYGPQWKMWRLNATADWNGAFNNFLGEIAVSGNYPFNGPRDNLYVMLWCAPVQNWDCTQPYVCFPYGYPNGTYAEHTLGQTQTGQPFPNDANQWVRWEVYVKASSNTDVKDGTFIFRCLIPGQQPWRVEWENNICTHRTLESTPGVSTWLAWTRFCWQNYWGSCGTDAEWFFDDIYLQTGSQARVELGDSPIFECSTKREIQEVTSWSDTSISLVLNHGSFTPGQLAYLYVVREDGSVSSAMPLALQ